MLNSNTSSTCPVNMVTFGLLMATIPWRVWGTPANFNGFRFLAALLHGTLVVGVRQTLRHWTEGATYIRQGGHHVGHWPTFLVCICDAVRLGSKGRVAHSLVNTCLPEHFRDEYHTHYKALYKCPVYFSLLCTLEILEPPSPSRGTPTRYLFRVSNSGPLCCTKRVLTTPSQSHPLLSPTPLRS